MIPAKACVHCHFINSCENTSCKRCGEKLGREWGDIGHISVGYCEFCKRNVGVSGNMCACGDIVPQRYEDFFNGRVKNSKNKASGNSTSSSSTDKKKKGWW